jgi:hypothetical protein
VAPLASLGHTLWFWGAGYLQNMDSSSRNHGVEIPSDNFDALRTGKSQKIGKSS